MFWGSLLIFFTLGLFSIAGVVLIHPINHEVAASGIYEGCERCPRAFASVGQTMVTLSQQLLLGDSWGQVSIPIIEHSPLSAIYFISSYLLICLVLLNVILAVVVDSSNQTSERITT